MLWGGGCNGAGPNSMVVVDSLSAALMRERPLAAGRRLRATLGAGRGEEAGLRVGVGGATHNKGRGQRGGRGHMQ